MLDPQLKMTDPEVEPIVVPDAPVEHAPPASLLYRTVTRTWDIIGASLGLALSAPVMAVVALLVRVDSPGPVIFKHQRVGRNLRRGQHEVAGDRRRHHASGRPFTLYKFRSMQADARERFPELYAYRYSAEELRTLPIKVLVGTKGSPEHLPGPIEKGEAHDPRLTGVGRWLRKTSLDELPNLWNVLVGDMTIVGPRPDIEENVKYYTPSQMKKLDVKPGLTGLAQVMGRGHLSFHETNEYDVQYVENRSLFTDVRIMIKTVTSLIRRDGAY